MSVTTPIAPPLYVIHVSREGTAKTTGRLKLEVLGSDALPGSVVAALG